MHYFLNIWDSLIVPISNDIIMVGNIVLCKCTKAPGTAIPEAFSMWRLAETHQG